MRIWKLSQGGGGAGVSMAIWGKACGSIHASSMGIHTPSVNFMSKNGCFVGKDELPVDVLVKVHCLASAGHFITV